jgi:hypothetical protein
MKMTIETNDLFAARVMLNAMSQRDEIRQLMNELRHIYKYSESEQPVKNIAQDIYHRLAIILNNVSEN